MAWGGLAVILLHSMLEYPLWYGPFLFAAMVCLVGLVHPLVETDGPPRWWALAASLAVMTFTCALVWDYYRVSQIYLPPAQRAPEYRSDALSKIRDVFFFQSYVQYAELTTMALTPDNAQQVYDLAQAMLHFSAEPRVIEKLLDSSVQLHRWDELPLQLRRYQAAFPKEYALWMAQNPGPWRP